jgi:hypothetical protein
LTCLSRDFDFTGPPRPPLPSLTRDSGSHSKSSGAEPVAHPPSPREGEGHRNSAAASAAGEDDRSLSLSLRLTRQSSYSLAWSVSAGAGGVSPRAPPARGVAECLADSAPGFLCWLLAVTITLFMVRLDGCVCVGVCMCLYVCVCVYEFVSGRECVC